MQRPFSWSERVAIAFAVISLAFAAVRAVVFGGWEDFAIIAPINIVVIAAVLGMRFAYRAGWLRGRAALMVSMVEAQHRGLTAAQWIIAEAERDGMNIERMPIEGDDEC